MTEEKTIKFISLMNDSTFKYIFKNSKTRPFLEKVIFYTTGINLEGFTLIDNELSTGNKIKDYRLDILLKKDNNIISIEMNSNSKYSKSISRKNHSYLYRIAGNTYRNSDNYTEQKYVTQINFNNYTLSDNKNLRVASYEFLDKENNLKIEGIKNYEIYLPNYKLNCYNNCNEKEILLSLFTANSFNEMDEVSKNNEEAMKIVEELKVLGLDDEFGATYDYTEVQKKLEESLKIEARIEGKEEGKIEIAKSMLNKNMDISLISEITGLSVDTIKSFQED